MNTKPMPELNDYERPDRPAALRDALQPWTAVMRFILRRVLFIGISLLGAVTLVFFFTLATGNPVLLLTGGAASKEDIAAVMRLHGLDLPVWQQYLIFLRDAVTGNFPKSLRFDASPFDMLWPALRMTLLLASAATVVSLLIGLAVGYLSVRASSVWIRRSVLALLTLVQSVPVFISGLLLVLLFSVRLGWLPTAGAEDLRHLILPTLTLALLLTPQIARVFRASLIENGNSDHVRAALSRNIPLRTIEIRHVVMNSLTPVIALLGVQLGSVFGGTVLTETVFGWPGLGTAFVSAVAVKDYPVIIACIAIIAVIIGIFGLASDLLTRWMDPRGREVF